VATEITRLLLLSRNSANYYGDKLSYNPLIAVGWSTLLPPFITPLLLPLPSYFLSPPAGKVVAGTLKIPGCIMRLGQQL
jgi:hypothetical protein